MSKKLQLSSTEIIQTCHAKTNSITKLFHASVSLNMCFVSGESIFFHFFNNTLQWLIFALIVILGFFFSRFSMDYDLFAKCCQVLGLASEIIFLLEVGVHKW